MSVSLDGFAAGVDQAVEDPLGVGGERLHVWLFAAPAVRRLSGEDVDDEIEGVDDRFFYAGDDSIGATIMGRNMFGPVRGDWPDAEWRGWWGPEPPYRHPVFVLTHHERASFDMAGGTTFHFVTGGIREAYDRAMEAADGADVRLGGGVSTVRQYLEVQLVDEMHLVIVPVLLGRGEHLLGGFDEEAIGLELVEHVASPAVTHVRYARRTAS
jgi:dihydrofolate reductase